MLVVSLSKSKIFRLYLVFKSLKEGKVESKLQEKKMIKKYAKLLLVLDVHRKVEIKIKINY